ncbi:MAG: hypothetical protein ABH811_02750 [archaeon]
MNSKAYLQISFAWLFAIIVGAVILFLAIFFVTKLIKTEQTISDAKTGKEIGFLLNPLEIGFESAKSITINFPTETRIYNKCRTNGNFGRQLVQVSQKNFEKWTETDIDVGFSNKYIFSEEYTEGKDFYIFSKSFDFSFKITDIVYLTSQLQEYCFLDAPEKIQEELMFLNQKNLLIENCSDKSTRVCFRGGGNCDIRVEYGKKRILKNSEFVYFEGDALMYAGIFSDFDIYECQVKRLMQRTDNLAQLYHEKALFLSNKGCESNLDLVSLSNLANKLEDSSDLSLIKEFVEEIDYKNSIGDCRLW